MKIYSALIAIVACQLSTWMKCLRARSKTIYNQSINSHSVDTDMIIGATNRIVSSQERYHFLGEGFVRIRSRIISIQFVSFLESKLSEYDELGDLVQMNVDKNCMPVESHHTSVDKFLVFAKIYLESHLEQDIGHPVAACG